MQLQTDKAILVIGDVHGCIREFQSQLNQVEDALGSLEHVHIISVGDLVDRGPDSHGVLRLWDSLPHKTLVMGNHESKALRKGLTYRGNHDADVPGANMVQEPLDDELTAILQTAEPWVSFERGGKTFLCVHGGLFPAWMRSHGTSLDGLPGPDASKKVTQRWLRTTMTRHIDFETGQMVGLGLETEDTPYWASAYGKVWNYLGTPSAGSWDFRLLDANDQVVHVLFGHQPHKDVLDDMAYPPYEHAIPLDYGVPFGGDLVAVLYRPGESEPTYFIQSAFAKYALTIEELAAAHA